MMYHFQNQNLYNSTYEQFIQEKCSNDLLQPQQNKNTEYKLVIEQNAVDTNGPQPGPGASSPIQEEVGPKAKQDMKPNPRNRLDTSSFSIEERLVAGVWMHERKRTKTSISQIKIDYRERFGREPPTKNTLLLWERKLFATGSVHDAPRTGRPVKRRNRINDVAASLSSTPSLSMRARAANLRMSVTTLRNILYKDLQQAHVKKKDSVVKKGKQPLNSKKNTKKPQVPNQYENVNFTQPSGYGLVYTDHTYI